MAAKHWIVKQEPGDYSWEDFSRDGGTAWTGVRNYQARNHLRAMKRGDWVLFYHSGEEKRLVGLAQVKREAYADPTATKGDWSCVDLVPILPLNRPVGLSAIKAEPKLQALSLVRQSRLSVVPATVLEFRLLLRLAATRLPS